jgi:hypothetical protein
MLLTAKRIVTVAGLLGAGWAVGRAQPATPSFELLVNAPAGQVTVECVRGCKLAWVERGVNPAAVPMQTFSFRCSGPGVERCGSGRIGGWTEP